MINNHASEEHVGYLVSLELAAGHYSCHYSCESHCNGLLSIYLAELASNPFWDVLCAVTVQQSQVVHVIRAHKHHTMLTPCCHALAFRWRFSGSGGGQYLDASVLVFSGVAGKARYMDYVDYKKRTLTGCTGLQQTGSLIQHSGDVINQCQGTGLHTININLNGLPSGENCICIELPRGLFQTASS